MIYNNEFYLDNNDQTIVTVDDAEINYGRLRSIKTESSLEFVADIQYCGDLVEIFETDSLEMGPFDGRFNPNLTIEVGDDGTVMFLKVWPVSNDHVDRLCRIFATKTNEHIRVVSKARILAFYENYEVKEKSHDLTFFYDGITEEELAATTWPRQEMNLEIATQMLRDSIRDELRDYAFGDKEIYWRDQYGHPVATGYDGSSSCSVTMEGFDITFSEEESRDLIRLGKLGEVERNDSMDDEDYD
jgi:hypothetical protein